MKIKTDPSIIAASHLIFKLGLHPYRVVLRKVNGKYITGLETLTIGYSNWRHVDFSWEHFFDGYLDDAVYDFNKLIKAFK